MKRRKKVITIFLLLLFSCVLLPSACIAYRAWSVDREQRELLEQFDITPSSNERQYDYVANSVICKLFKLGASSSEVNAALDALEADLTEKTVISETAYELKLSFSNDWRRGSKLSNVVLGLNNGVLISMRYQYISDIESIHCEN